MNPRVWKLAGAVALSLVVALAAGWFWGASGRWEAERRLSDLQLRHQLTDARAHLLEARVDLYRLNFGAATTNLEAAKPPLNDALAELDRRGETARATAVRTALTAAEEARRMAAQVNQAAQGAAERALNALAEAQPAATR